jgi:hypothetical protein
MDACAGREPFRQNNRGTWFELAEGKNPGLRAQVHLASVGPNPLDTYNLAGLAVAWN